MFAGLCFGESKTAAYELAPQRAKLQILEETPDTVADTRQRRLREPIPDSLQQQSQLLAPHLSRHLRTTPNSNNGVPVVVEPDGSRCLYVLHMFSGRRRDGDCHYWIHKVLGAYFPGFRVKIFSVDTAIHEKCGNLASGENFNFVWKAVVSHLGPCVWPQLLGDWWADPCASSCSLLLEASSCSTIYTWRRWLSFVVAAR